ncbi:MULTISPECIES: hypothetical protein [Providencia]|uniref:Lipoprotein n=1 Tax=Providencia heimbachae ATCC 35613 TaxID=1354272 RepID=A0A1B7K073_9GAMM|nr:MULTISPECIES: hypothetical protein [Providencia]MBP6120763.1 hypothetical protein [Providencia sp.]NIH23222.1 hypothetical protein [Providencia heimbachae]OAT53563.1 hypothetical protein M998_0812 [Providencia heimbachae ATCC 35613]SQH13872.1 Uncharacterised protein [Providencia heimbachae]
MKKGLVVLFALLITGCTAVLSNVHDLTMGKYKYDNKHSDAWNISTAAKKEAFKDVKAEYIAKNISGNPEWKWKDLSDKEHNLSLVDFSSVMPSYNVGWSSQDFEIDGLFVWVPNELAANPEDARELVVVTMENAIRKAYGNANNRYKDRNNKDGYGGDTGIIQAAMSGAYNQTTRLADIYFDQHDKNIVCAIPDRKKQEKRECSSIYISQGFPRGEYTTPSFLPLNSTGKSYLFTPRNDDRVLPSSIDIYPVEMPARTIASDVVLQRKKMIIAQKLSENLPPWFIFYFKPMYKYGLPAMVVKEGKTYFFTTE